MAKHQETQSFYQRNKIGLNVLGFGLLGGAAFASVYFTAGTTLPWIVSTASKIGLDLSILSTWSVPVASGVVAAAGTGALGVVYGVTSTIASGISALWGWARGSNSAPAEHKTVEPELDDLGTSYGLAAKKGLEPLQSPAKSPVQTTVLAANAGDLGATIVVKDAVDISPETEVTTTGMNP